METMLQFTKGHATGNDFILYTDHDGDLELTPEQVQALCDRRFGIGADGVIRAVRSEMLPEGSDALAQDDAAEWFMDYRNADGSIGAICGNGIRVYAEYLIEEGLVELPKTDTLSIGTRSGVRDLQQNKNGFQVDLGRWRLEAGEPLVRTKDLPVARPGLGVDVGNHHVVVALANDDELEQADLTFIPQIEPEPAHDTNVELVVPGDPLVRDGVGHIRMRVHEHGSGETLSCGTGAVAAALAIRHWAGRKAPNQWRVQVPGGVLGVRMFPTEDGEHVALSGPAELVFEGTVSIDL